jgi:hypothetical protein
VPDDLDISGGTTAVSTEDLHAAGDQLKQLGGESSAMATVLAQLEAPLTPGSFHGGQARVDIDLAAHNLRAVSQRADLLATFLATAAESYEVNERMVAEGVRYVQSSAAQLVGYLVPGLVMGATLACSLGLAAWAGIQLAGGLGGLVGGSFEKGGVPKASPFVREINHVFNSAVSAGIIRTMVQGLGPFLMGAMRVPPGVPQALGTTPFEFGARQFVGLGRNLGLFDETPVKLVETRDQPLLGAPGDYVDRLSRVPHGPLGETGPQVVIERYAAPGEPDRFSVYIGGTVTFSPAESSEPWDMTSNVVNATGLESGSVASVRAAMDAAGIGKDNPVQFTGFSQGGGTAARLVASGDFNIHGLLTFGGPTGQVPLPAGVPTVLVEHADDPVPALGGEQPYRDAVLVRRDVFGGTNIDKTWAVPSHHIEYYLKTAQIMDESRSPQLDSTLRKLDSFTAGATLESSTAYRFERVLEKD